MRNYGGVPIFDPVAAAAVEEWRRRTGAVVELQAEFLTGATDANVYSATLTLPEEGYHEIVVKRCRARKDGAFESERLIRARASNQDFAAKHLVKNVRDPIALIDGGTILIQETAGDSVRDNQTLAQALNAPSGLQRWTPNVTALALSLLSEWNQQGNLPTSTHANSLLRTVLGDYRLHDRGPIATWLRDNFPSALDVTSEWLRIPGERATQVNPWAFASNLDGICKSIKVQNWSGRIHGDLHPGNIIVQKSVAEENYFWLIDLSRFAEQLPLTLDQTYLYLTALAPHVASASEDELADLVDVVVSQQGRPARLAPELIDFIRGIQSAGRLWLEGRGVQSKWHDLSLLALCANGLILAARTNMPTKIQFWYFRIACRAAGELARNNGVNPTAGSARSSFQGARTPDGDESASAAVPHINRDSSTPTVEPNVESPINVHTHRRIRISVGILAVLAIMSVWVLAGDLVSSKMPTYKVQVDANPDTIIMNERFAKPGGSYVTDVPASDIPDPPSTLNSCIGRYTWAHSSFVNGVDADVSIVRVSFTTHDRSIGIVGAKVHSDDTPHEAMAGAHLTCPGRGGNEPPHVIEVNLDNDEIEFYPSGNGNPETMNVRIAPETTETILVIGHISSSRRKWRIQMHIDDVVDHTLTIGPTGSTLGTGDENPEQEPFETTSSINCRDYWFRDGDWRQVR